MPSCAQAGVLGVLPGQIGTLMAAEAIKLITGIGEPLIGRLLLLDALATRWREMRVVADPGRAPVTELMQNYIAFCGLAQAGADVPHVSLADFAAQVAAGQLAWRLVDVRQPQEAELGMIDGAELLPLPSLLQAASSEALAQHLPGLQQDTPLLLYCQSGQRSATAAAHLQKLGFTQVQVLDANVAAWRALQG